MWFNIFTHNKACKMIWCCRWVVFNIWFWCNIHTKIGNVVSKIIAQAIEEANPLLSLYNASIGSFFSSYITNPYGCTNLLNLNKMHVIYKSTYINKIESAIFRSDIFIVQMTICTLLKPKHAFSKFLRVCLFVRVNFQIVWNDFGETLRE